MVISLKWTGLANAKLTNQRVIGRIDEINHNMIEKLAEEIVEQIKSDIVTTGWTSQSQKSIPSKKIKPESVLTGKTNVGHVVTGDMLRKTGILINDKDGVVVGSSSGHAGFHEFGTSKFVGHPIFQGVIFSMTPKFNDVLVNEYTEEFGESIDLSEDGV